MENKNIGSSYLYAYGLGSSERIKLSMTTYGYAYNDTVFVLPININSDTSKYCFVRNDLSIDTIGIRYSLIFGVFQPSHSKIKCYNFAVSNLSLYNLSGDFKVDSSYVIKNSYNPEITLKRK